MTSGRALAEAVFGAVDSMRGEALAQFMTPDGSFTFGNAPPAVGRAAIASTVDQFFSGIDGLSHTVEDVWERDGSVVVRLSISYTRKDGGKVVLPCANIWQRDASGQIADYRIYMDVNPVFA